MSSRMLKRSASIRRLLGVRREKLEVKRRSVEGSSSAIFHLSLFTFHFSRRTRTALLSILRDRTLMAQTAIGFLGSQHRYAAPC